MPRIALLVPCYNEEEAIGKVVRDFKAIDPDMEIFVYDNNSSDNTAEVAAQAGAIVCKEYRQGKGFVIRSMFRDIDADVYIMVDGDDTYNAAETYALAQDVLDGRADMVVGDRLSSTYFIENKRPFHNSGNRIVRGLINSLFGSEIHDVMTGARAFSQKFVKSYASLVGGFEIETEMTIHALDKNFIVTQHPVTYTDRDKGVSKVSTFSDGGRILKIIFALFKDFRPLQFFGWTAGALFAVGFVLFLRPLLEYFRTGVVLYMPSLVTAVFFLMAALMAFVCGIILDAIRKQTRIFYELNLNKICDEITNNKLESSNKES